MVKLIDETIHYYKTQCQHCKSYLVFEREDEMISHYGNNRMWFIKCPNCGHHTPTYEMADGQLIDYQIK